METETVRDQREIDLLLCDRKLVRQVFPELIMVCVCVFTSSLKQICLMTERDKMHKYFSIFNAKMNVNLYILH